MSAGEANAAASDPLPPEEPIDWRTREAIEALIQREAALLDLGAYEDWLKLYTDDAYYWVPRRPAQTNPQSEVSLFYDDRMLMETRVRRLTTAIAHAETPRTRTLRVVSRADIRNTGAPRLSNFATAKFVMLEYRLNTQRVYGGTSHFMLRPDGPDTFKIVAKRVDLVNAEGTHEPMSVPF